jgi:hypothetical protein
VGLDLVHNKTRPTKVLLHDDILARVKDNFNIICVHRACHVVVDISRFRCLQRGREMGVCKIYMSCERLINGKNKFQSKQVYTRYGTYYEA